MKTKIQIKTWGGTLLFEYESEDNTLRQTLEAAVRQAGGYRLRGPLTGLRNQLMGALHSYQLLARNHPASAGRRSNGVKKKRVEKKTAGCKPVRFGYMGRSVTSFLDAVFLPLPRPQLRGLSCGGPACASTCAGRTGSL